MTSCIDVYKHDSELDMKGREGIIREYSVILWSYFTYQHFPFGV